MASGATFTQTQCQCSICCSAILKECYSLSNSKCLESKGNDSKYKNEANHNKQNYDFIDSHFDSTYENKAQEENNTKVNDDNAINHSN